MVLRPVSPFLRSGVTRTPVIERPSLSIVSEDAREVRNSGTLPRSNSHEPSEAPPPMGFAGWLSHIFRTHRRPVMGVMAGVASLGAMTNVAMATQPDAQPASGTNGAEGAASAATTAESFERARLTEYPLFKLFWNSPNPHDGTAHQGLDEVTAQGVQTLVDYAKKHNLDGSVSAPGQGTISAAERELIKAILEHRDYGTFFELDALPLLYQNFGIEGNAVHSVASDLAEARATLARILGMNVHEVKLSFPEAGPTHETTYLAMDGKMAEPMRYVDLYREAIGLPKGAEAHEKGPVLGYMMGIESGHTKYGSFSERQPFSTSGLNWGVLLFPNDAEVANLPVKQGFEFPIDVLTGFGRVVGAVASNGDRIVPHDQAGNRLSAEKIIHRDASGNAVSWSAKFTNAAGEEVNPADVIGLVKTSWGSTKGDGRVDGTINMGWWGFCDRNTAGRLYKSMFQIPNVDRDVRIEVNGQIITIPKDDAQKLLDVDVTDMAGRTRFVGNRFDDEPAKIALAGGGQVTGKLKGMVLRVDRNATRTGGDNITIRNLDSHPIRGSIELENNWGGKSLIDLQDVISITKDPATGNVEVELFNRSHKETGKLSTDISFEGAEHVDGKLVLRNTDEKPIIGDVHVDIGGGQTKVYEAGAIRSISGEMEHEMKVSEYLKFIEANHGMYATDNATGVIVSNGMRWLNRVDVVTHEGAENPEWAQGKMHGVNGPLQRKAGDKLVHIDGLYKTEWGNGMHSAFKGWIQLDSQDRIINEGFLSGEPDFGWAARGPLDWNARSSFNPHMTPELRLKLLVNGVSDLSKLESAAERLNLPSNWRDLRTPEAQ